jgi:predicted negative regulator of RcsB-dependent stress response
MAEHVYLLTLFLPLATVLIIFGMKYYASVQQAKARLASDEAYRQVAEQAAAAQAETAAALADLKTRLATIEKILREVE